jgi:hypothetical protein
MSKNAAGATVIRLLSALAAAGFDTAVAREPALTAVLERNWLDVLPALLGDVPSQQGRDAVLAHTQRLVERVIADPVALWLAGQPCLTSYTWSIFSDVQRGALLALDGFLPAVCSAYNHGTFLLVHSAMDDGQLASTLTPPKEKDQAERHFVYLLICWEWHAALDKLHSRQSACLIACVRAIAGLLEEGDVVRMMFEKWLEEHPSSIEVDCFSYVWGICSTLLSAFSALCLQLLGH